MSDENRKYNFAFSFAGEDRGAVEAIANFLKFCGVSVFYDEWEKHHLLGEDLYTYLGDVYEKQADYCVVFISKASTNKKWPRHERRFAFARAFEQERPYILPVRLDETPCQGIPSTTGFLDGSHLSPTQIGMILLQKLGLNFYRGGSSDIMLNRKMTWRISRNGTVHAKGDFEFMNVEETPRKHHTYHLWAPPAGGNVDIRNIRAQAGQKAFKTEIISSTQKSCDFRVILDPPLYFADTVSYVLEYESHRHFNDLTEQCEDTFRVSIPIWSWVYKFIFPENSLVEEFEAFRTVGDEVIRVPCFRSDDGACPAFTITHEKPKVGAILKVVFKIT